MGHKANPDLLIPVDPKAKGLIFDCDGTLADTVPLHIEAWQKAFEVAKLPCHHEFLMDQMGIPSRNIVRNFNREFGWDLDPEAFTQVKEQRFQELIPKIKPIAPVMDIIEKYKGKLPMSVASGGRAANVMPTLKAIGLEGFFPIILTSDDPVKGKPSPDLFLEAARRMAVEPEFCQVFEDGKAGIKAAKEAGMMITDVLAYLNP